MTYIINGKNYIEIEYLIADSNKLSELKKDVMDFGLLYKGVKEIKKSTLFGKGYAIFSLYCPEDKITAFTLKMFK